MARKAINIYWQGKIKELFLSGFGAKSIHSQLLRLEKDEAGRFTSESAPHIRTIDRYLRLQKEPNFALEMMVTNVTSGETGMLLTLQSPQKSTLNRRRGSVGNVFQIELSIGHPAVRYGDVFKCSFVRLKK